METLTTTIIDLQMAIEKEALTLGSSYKLIYFLFVSFLPLPLHRHLLTCK
jgi:hypothetical protein